MINFIVSCLQSYCEKHSMNTKKDKTSLAILNSGSEDEGTDKKKTRTMTAEERNHARAEKYATFHWSHKGKI